MSSRQQHYPNLDPYGTANGNGTSLEGMKNSVANNTQTTMDSIKNSQTVQQLANGPVGETARAEVNATKNEFSNLAASRQTPETQTANGQDLTHYHSLFYNLLSWENPRATTISYATTAASIFAFRYVPVSRYILRVLYMTLGATAVAEVLGQVVLGQGFATKMRPKRYYTIPHETLHSILNDAEELINFFVIEFQRIVFVENIYVTIGAFLSAFITYYLVKLMPTWGLALFFTTVIYFAPLVYVQNKEFIDEHINNASNLVAEQANQVRDLAAHHTNNAMQASHSAIKDYSVKAQEIMGQTKKAAMDKGLVSPQTADKVAPKTETSSPMSQNTYSTAPKIETPAPVSQHTSDTAPKVDTPASVNNESFPTVPKTELIASSTGSAPVTAEPLASDEHKTPIVA